MPSRTLSILVELTSEGFVAQVWGEDQTKTPRSDPKPSAWDAIIDMAQKMKKTQKGASEDEVRSISW